MQFLGLDSSTQGLKALILEEDSIIAEESVRFGKDLPEFRSPDGFLPSPDPEICHADPLLWLAALDLLLERMQKKGIRFERIAGISGSGQQHGSVYLNEYFETILRTLDPAGTLAEQLRPALSRNTSPIWMDHSTAEECRLLTDRFGGELQKRTGSAATERFTGPQIMRFARTEPERWAETRHVHLVSSFLCSVLCGKSSPVDPGDGAGMNLLNLKTMQWDPEIVSFTAPGSKNCLPEIVPGNTVAGTLSPYFEKYGFRNGIPVLVWSGDNPSSLVGTGNSRAGSWAISLGTSDTVFAPMAEFHTDPAGCGHVFGNPSGGFMSLICFSNGSLAREKLRQEMRLEWAELDPLVRETTEFRVETPLMLPWFVPECTPSAGTPEKRTATGKAPRTDAGRFRMLLESQALAMRLHSQWIGGRPERIRLTGGASASGSIRQIIADVFGAKVEILSRSDSAGLGAAMRAANVIGKIPLPCLEERFCKAETTVLPEAGSAAAAERKLAIYGELEKRAL